MTMRKRKRIYLDYAASTPTLPEVVEAMTPYWRNEFGNAGAIYQEGVAAKRILEDSREKIAGLIGAHADEVVFTSGGTESNNLAIFGFVEALLKEGRALTDLHFVTSMIEHPSVLDCFKVLEKKGASVTYCGVTPEGLSDPKEVKESLRENTALVSIAYVNNEIGTIQMLAEIAEVIRSYKKNNSHRTPEEEGWNPFFHTDASQAPLYLDCRVLKLGVDMLTLDAQKMYGPKGSGLLFVKHDTPLLPIMHGGSQEHGLRPGTPVTPLVVGLAKAFELADAHRAKESERLTTLRDYCILEITKHIPRAVLNGDPKTRLPNNINMSFPGIDNGFLVLQLDAKGIAVGTRSACLSADGAGSYVIEALGKGKEHSKTSIRVTLGINTFKTDIDYFIKTLTALVTAQTR